VLGHYGGATRRAGARLGSTNGLLLRLGLLPMVQRALGFTFPPLGEWGGAVDGAEGGEEFDARLGLRGRKGRFGARDVPREDVDARRWGTMFFSARGRWSYLLVEFTL
jgi:hypothetical protein